MNRSPIAKTFVENDQTAPGRVRIISVFNNFNNTSNFGNIIILNANFREIKNLILEELFLNTVHNLIIEKKSLILFYKPPTKY